MVSALVDSNTHSVKFDIATHHGNGVSAIRPDAANKTVVRHSKETRSMQTVPLHRILNDMHAPHLIDFLSLDVEGLEEKVLAGHDFQRHRFLVITVERPSSTLVALLRTNGYEYVLDHGTYGDQMWILNATHGNGVRASLGFADSSIVASRVRGSYQQWNAIIHSQEWSVRRAGISPIRRTKSIYNCCGVPAAWVANGSAPVDRQTNSDLVAPGRVCRCPY